jgi:hypothetical protein
LVTEGALLCGQAYRKLPPPTLKKTKAYYVEALWGFAGEGFEGDNLVSHHRSKIELLTDDLQPLPPRRL